MLKISFIVPSYQQAPYLKVCLDSIVNQGLPREVFEVLVFDGGSTDASARILESHPLSPRWLSESDDGQTSAVNRGFREARGEIFAWINSDDFFMPRVFPQLLDYFESHPRIPIVYGEADWVDATGETLGPYPVEDWDYSRLADKCFLCQPAVIFRRTIPEEFGSLDETFHVAMDLEYWLRIGKWRSFTRIPVKIAASRLHDGIKSRSFPLRMQLEALKAGYIHQGRLSKKRLWSVAENRIFARHSGLRARFQRRESSWCERSRFSLHKIYAYLKLKVDIARSRLPWTGLPDTLPKVPEVGA